jgi:hypothetical protein
MQSGINPEDHEDWIKETFDTSAYSTSTNNSPGKTPTGSNSKAQSAPPTIAPLKPAEARGIYPGGQPVHSPTASRPKTSIPASLSPQSSPPPIQHKNDKHIEPPSPVPPHIQAIAGEYVSLSGDWLSWTKFGLTLETDGTFRYRFHYEDHSSLAWGEEEMIGTWTSAQGGIIATTHHQSVEGKMDTNKPAPRTEYCDVDMHGRWIFFNSVYLNRAA